MAVLLLSCESHSYDTGDGELSYMRADYADIMVMHGRVDYTLTDEGEELLLPAYCDSLVANYQDTILRRLLYYNKGTREIELLKMEEVKILSPSTPEKIGDMKRDPLTLYSIWKAKNQRYINMSLGVKTGSAAPEDAVQILALSIDSVHSADKGRAYLSLRHEQGDVPQYYTRKVLVSMPYPKQDTVTITVNTYKGPEEHTFIWK
ncbi:MAG: hypothetical protein KBT34_09640 [Prevotella sp.]|nr:hypothetical protein [Candidatus Prevotella equi]